MVPFTTAEGGPATGWGDGEGAGATGGTVAVVAIADGAEG